MGQRGFRAASVIRPVSSFPRRLQFKLIDQLIDRVRRRDRRDEHSADVAGHRIERVGKAAVVFSLQVMII